MILLVVFNFLLFQNAYTDDICAISDAEINRLMSLSYQEFDQTLPDGGWRKYGNRECFQTAILLLEEGCAEFSNIQGLGQIRFPKGKISATFEEIRKVLEREELIRVA